MLNDIIYTSQALQAQQRLADKALNDKKGTSAAGASSVDKVAGFKGTVVDQVAQSKATVTTKADTNGTLSIDQFK